MPSVEAAAVPLNSNMVWLHRMLCDDRSGVWLKKVEVRDGVGIARPNGSKFQALGEAFIVWKSEEMVLLRRIEGVCLGDCVMVCGEL